MTSQLPAEAPQAAPEALAEPVASVAPGAGLSIRAFVCGIVALLVSAVAVVSWPFMILAVVFAVLGLRRRAAKRWMSIVALVLVGVALLGTFILPTLTVLVGLGMFGEVTFGGVVETFWFYWVGQYLFIG